MNLLLLLERERKGVLEDAPAEVSISFKQGIKAAK